MGKAEYQCREEIDSKYPLPLNNTSAELGFNNKLRLLETEYASDISEIVLNMNIEKTKTNTAPETR